jgi:hypothetical protein
MTLTPQDLVAKWKRVTAHERQACQELKKLDAAVFDAYAWPHDLADE